MRAAIEEWALRESPEWRLVPSGGAAYRLLWRGSNVLYCRDAPSRGYSNIFVERARESDVDTLSVFGLEPARFEPDHRGVRVLVRPKDVEALLEWCHRREAGTPAAQGAVLLPALARLPRPDHGSLGSLEEAVRGLIEPGWPHDYEAYVESLGNRFRSYPPVYCVGSLGSLVPGFTLFIGMNPNIRPVDRGYIAEIIGTFERYWNACTEYFAGPFFYSGHYDVHAAYLAGLLGLPIPQTVKDAATVLDENAAALDLCPLSSSNATGLKEFLMQPSTPSNWHGFRVSRDVLNALVTVGHPARIVARYGTTRDLLLRWYGRGSRSTVEIGGDTLPLFCIPNRPRRPGDAGGNPTSLEAFELGQSARLGLAGPPT